MITVKQIKAARALIGWDQAKLAAASGLSFPTIQRIESLGPGRSKLDNVEKVITAIENAGVKFTDPNGGGEGVKFRVHPSKRPPDAKPKPSV